MKIHTFHLLLRTKLQGGLCMWGVQPPDRDKEWLEEMVDIFCPLLYNISVNINSVTATMLCYSNNIIKYNSIEREYKDYFKKALHSSTLAQSTGHSCLMYPIRFMTIYDCFYNVKTYCTLQFSFEPLAKSIKQAHLLVWRYATTVLLTCIHDYVWRFLHLIPCLCTFLLFCWDHYISLFQMNVSYNNLFLIKRLYLIRRARLVCTISIYRSYKSI